MKKIDLYTITGVSGAGKSTLAEVMCKDYGFTETISHTTRVPREGEITEKTAKENEKIAYFFITKAIFRRMENLGEFIESVTFGDNKYGVHKSQVLNYSEKSKIVIVVEPEGARQIKAWAKKNSSEEKSICVTSVLLNISEDTQIKRMRLRGDKPKDIAKRLEDDNIRERIEIDNFDLILNAEKLSAEKIAAITVSLIEE